MEHLSPGGILTIVTLNKLQQVRMLRKIHERRGWEDFEDSIVILRNVRDDPKIWAYRMDRLILVYRKGGFDDESLMALTDVAGKIDHTVAYGPRGFEEEYWAFQRAVRGQDWQSLPGELSKNILVDISSTPDDRPYAKWLMPAWMLLDPQFWRDQRGTGWIARRAQFLTLFAIMIAAIVLVVTPLLLKPGPARTRRNGIHLQYFMCLGVGFMLIETGLVMKFSLLLGNPGYSIAVVLAALIMSTGLGSLISEKSFATGTMNYSRAVIGVLISLLWLDRATTPHTETKVVERETTRPV